MSTAFWCSKGKCEAIITLSAVEHLAGEEWARMQEQHREQHGEFPGGDDALDNMVRATEFAEWLVARLWDEAIAEDAERIDVKNRRHMMRRSVMP